ncbi:beta/gamma crystallin domain-containing protein [Frankia sp. Cj3]|uniref:beta/gamma crystallin domain-containing protein n=1 Tax=Frankia sp. Cj3 TaxID=2880976 RepID=UPI0035B27D41
MLPRKEEKHGPLINLSMPRKDLTVKRAFASVFTAMAVTLGLVATAGSAQAINRVSCSRYDFLWLQSNQTTCWANAGYTNVTLYNVYGGSSGNNAGWYSGDSYTVYFPKWSSWSYPAQTVRAINIY